MKTKQDLINFLNTVGFKSYAWYYMIHTGKKLKTIEDLINVLEDPCFTFEDFFYHRFDDFDFNDEEEKYLGDNMEKFDFEIYYPNKDKQINEGAWIEVRTEKGYSIHWAKRYTKKVDYDKELAKLKVDFYNIMNNTKDFNLDDLKVNTDKTTEILIRVTIGLPQYRISYELPDGKIKILTTNEYRIVDIERFIEYVNDNIKQVKIKELFTSKDKNTLFYIRSRGISKSVAKIMANLKHCYFEVNMFEVFEEYNKTTRIKLIKVK